MTKDLPRESESQMCMKDTSSVGRFSKPAFFAGRFEKPAYGRSHFFGNCQFSSNNPAATTSYAAGSSLVGVGLMTAQSPSLG